MWDSWVATTRGTVGGIFSGWWTEVPIHQWRPKDCCSSSRRIDRCGPSLTTRSLFGGQTRTAFLMTVFLIWKKGQSFFLIYYQVAFFFAKPLCWFLNETSTRLRGKHIRKHRKCWARLQEMTQFSDIDLSRPVCNSLWRPVKEKANLIAATNDSHFCGSCTEQLKETQPIQEPVENDYCESCSI